jgi:hypothetical protein
MEPLIVLFLLPALIGGTSCVLFRTMKGASLAATLASPLVLFLCVKSVDPADTWSPLATLLASPLVIGVAVTAVLLCAGRAHARKHRGWHDA